MKIFEAEFYGMYPVPCGLIIVAETLAQAQVLAQNTVKHTEVKSVKEIALTGDPQVIFYESGDY